MSFSSIVDLSSEMTVEKLRRISTGSLVGREDSKQSTHRRWIQEPPWRYRFFRLLTRPSKIFENVIPILESLFCCRCYRLLLDSIVFYNCRQWLSLWKLKKEEATFVDEPTEAKPTVINTVLSVCRVERVAKVFSREEVGRIPIKLGGPCVLGWANYSEDSHIRKTPKWLLPEVILAGLPAKNLPHDFPSFSLFCIEWPNPRESVQPKKWLANSPRVGQCAPSFGLTTVFEFRKSICCFYFIPQSFFQISPFLFPSDEWSSLCPIHGCPSWSTPICSCFVVVVKQSRNQLSHCSIIATDRLTIWRERQIKIKETLHNLCVTSSLYERKLTRVPKKDWWRAARSRRRKTQFNSNKMSFLLLVCSRTK